VTLTEFTDFWLNDTANQGCRVTFSQQPPMHVKPWFDYDVSEGTTNNAIPAGETLFMFRLVRNSRYEYAILLRSLDERNHLSERVGLVEIDPFLFDKELNPSRLCHLELYDHLDSVYRSHGRDGQVTLM